MSYDEKLAQRVRYGLRNVRRVLEKPMMGGLTFMVNGKMCVGIVRNDLMVRLDPDIHEEALKRRGCREMDFTGRPMRGFVFVGPAGTKTPGDLKKWLLLALDFNKTAKATRGKKRKKSQQE